MLMICLASKPLPDPYLDISASTVPPKSRRAAHSLSAVHTQRTHHTPRISSTTGPPPPIRSFGHNRTRYTSKATHPILRNSLRLPHRPHSIYLPANFPLDLHKALAPLHLATPIRRTTTRQGQDLGLCPSPCPKQITLPDRQRKRID